MKYWRSGACIAAFLVAASAVAEAQSLSADDKSAIQELSASYMKALFGRKAEEFADLFVPDAGSFVSGFRGRMVGREMLAIRKLAGTKLGDYYEPDPKGVSRLLTSGVRIRAKDNAVTGRVFLKDGGYDDEVYEKLGPGQWRVKSSTHVAPKR
jgi:hypothetical protein